MRIKSQGISFRNRLRHREISEVLNCMALRFERRRRTPAIQLFGLKMKREQVISRSIRSFRVWKPSYTKIKLVELLLMLTELDTDLPKTGYTYISQTQRDRIRKIHDFVVEHMEEHHTIEELADRFELSPTAMKHYFKEVYGSSFYAYFRTYRLQIAERLLRDGRLSIAEIAGKVGYANPNKFTSAFRSVYGMPPTAYQKNVRMDRK